MKDFELYYVIILRDILYINMSFSLGTFAGTTALSIALVLPQDGQMVTIDVNDDWAATGRPIWEKVS